MRAPISGRVSRALVTPGNLVSGAPGSATLLTTIVTVGDAYVYADIDEATWRSFVAQTSVTYPTAFQADQSIQSALQLSSLPATIFISPEGEIVGKWVGRISQQNLRDQIRQHLGVEV